MKNNRLQLTDDQYHDAMELYHYMQEMYYQDREELI